MNLLRRTLLAAAAAPLLFAQLNPEQRRVDFDTLAALVAKQYAPYEWKRDQFGFDAFRIADWHKRAREARDDLAFFEVCAEYLAQLRDLHTGFFLPSDFSASIPLAADLYDGRALIDSINRAALPASLYPFESGDEIVSVDNEPVEDFINRVARLQSFANPRATRRWALDQLFARYQDVIPRAHEIGDHATLLVRRASSGALETYSIAWQKSGTPLLRLGPLPAPADVPTPEPSLERYRIRTGPPQRRLRGFGSLTPAFSIDTLVTRLGRNPGDRLYSGIFTAEGLQLAYLRIPTFSLTFAQQSTLLRQLDSEIDFFKRNTAGLVVDVMRNPGGDTCLGDEILRRLVPAPFRTVGDEIRPTLDLIASLRADLNQAVLSGANGPTLDALRGRLRDVETAYGEYRGRTGPLPLCSASLTVPQLNGSDGRPFAYDKPIIMLIDDFSTSAADVFPAIFQDTGRGLLVGMPTAGGGGIRQDASVGFYSEAFASVSLTLGTRAQTILVPGFPASNYIENIGARPDVELDLMTEANLRTAGRPFVQAFTQVLLDLIRGARAPAAPALP